MVFFCQIHRMFSCFVTSSVEIYCHSYAITMILATAEFLGGDRNEPDKNVCVWKEWLGCDTKMYALLIFQGLLWNSQILSRFWHMQSLKKLEKIGVLSHILHQNARLQCERCFTLALRLSHGFLGMWSLPIGKKNLLYSPWIELTSHQCKVYVEK